MFLKEQNCFVGKKNFFAFFSSFSAILLAVTTATKTASPSAIKMAKDRETQQPHRAGGEIDEKDKATIKILENLL
jgi:hypothetical protein